MRKYKYIWWAYLVEILAAAITLLALCLWLDSRLVATFIAEAAIDIATLFGAVMFAASLGFLWTFYSKADTDFYRWLDTRGAFRVYLYATLYSVAVSLLTTLSLIAIKQIKDECFLLFVVYLVILAIINLVTLVRNVVDLMLLNTRFNDVRARSKF